MQLAEYYSDLGGCCRIFSCILALPSINTGERLCCNGTLEDSAALLLNNFYSRTELFKHAA
ncbi:MAG: hypothetical protein OFPI_32780 [Osedax symbiont Rs2]|nr:MAG: hypothetical protein OFPI_32780 [Osedax symbiont Rs2]